jgi:predicted regulator of Ras-like GTPase activity (Roadblock/LC7/MglB family)
MQRWLVLGSLVLASALGLGGVGCRKSPLPPTPPPVGARQRLVVQEQFRLGALDFGADGIADALPAMLLTELAKLERFSVYEGGGIRSNKELGSAITEDAAFQYTDGYVSGTITSREADKVCFDVRLSNSVNHEVLFAQATCAGVQIAGDSKMIPDRAAIARLAEEITRTIKQVGDAKVVSVDGPLVVVAKGKDAGVIPGMVAYVVGTGETLADEALHKSVLQYGAVDAAELQGVSSRVVVGEIYVVAVEEKQCLGRLYRGDYVLPGDTVFFK